MGLFRFLKRERQPTAAAAAAISSEQYFRALAEKEAAEQLDTSMNDASTTVKSASEHNEDQAPQLRLDLIKDSGTVTPDLASPRLLHLSFDSPKSQLQLSPTSLVRRASFIARPLSRKARRMSANPISNLETVSSVLRNYKELENPNSVFDNHPTMKLLSGPLSSPVTSLAQSHKRNSSNLSSQRGSRTFVDILDAQSVIKHSNLLSRVQATGIRDYGEDVADRNNAINSFDMSQESPLLSTLPNFPHRPSTAREIETRKQRSSSIGSNQLRPFTAVSSQERRIVSDNTISDSASIISQHRLTAFHTKNSNDGLQEPIRPWTRDLVDVSQLNMSPGRHSPSPVVSRIRTWSRDSQDFQMSEKMRGKQPYRPSNLSHPGTSMSQHDLELRPSTPNSLTNSIAPSANIFDDITSGFGNIALHEYFPEFHSSSAAPSPQVSRNIHRSEVNTKFASSAACRLFELSIQLDDEPIPPRSSSIRNWSVSSMTPTSSSLHSSTGPRPRTSYTENTSIEIPASPDASLLAALSPKHSPCDATSAYYMKQVQLGVLQSSPIRNEVLNDPDDVQVSYSSDDEDFGIERPTVVSTRLDKAALDRLASEIHVSEEHLLFKDSGFGLAGGQLPGLFETIPEIPSDSPPRHLSIRSIRPQRSHQSHHSNYSQSHHSHRPRTSSRCHYRAAAVEKTIDHFPDFDYEHAACDLPPLDSMDLDLDLSN